MLELSADEANDESRDKGAELALNLLEHPELPLEIRIQAHIVRACYGEGNPVWHGEEAVRLMEQAMTRLRENGTTTGRAEENLLWEAKEALRGAQDLARRMKEVESDNEEGEG